MIPRVPQFAVLHSTNATFLYGSSFLYLPINSFRYINHAHGLLVSIRRGHYDTKGDACELTYRLLSYYALELIDVYPRLSMRHPIPMTVQMRSQADLLRRFIGRPRTTDIRCSFIRKLL